MGYSYTPLQPSRWRFEVDGIEIDSRTGDGCFKQYCDGISEKGLRLREDWRERVWEQMLAHYPDAVSKSGKRQNKAISVHAAGVFLVFISKLLKKGWKPVEDELAISRANTCLACPKFKQIAGCSICKLALKTVVRIPKQNQQALRRSLGQSLGHWEGSACQACHCYLPVKVWLPRELLGSSEEFAFDEACWMRTENHQ